MSAHHGELGHSTKWNRFDGGKGGGAEVSRAKVAIDEKVNSTCDLGGAIQYYHQKAKQRGQLPFDCST